MYKIFMLQCLATIIAALGAGFFAGTQAALSALFAGLACAVPNGIFAWSLRRAIQPSVLTFIVGELGKLMVITGLLILFWISWPDPHAGGLLAGLVITLQANLFGFLMRV